jgi:hypothetical protein
LIGSSHALWKPGYEIRGIDNLNGICKCSAPYHTQRFSLRKCRLDFQQAGSRRTFRQLHPLPYTTRPASVVVSVEYANPSGFPIHIDRSGVLAPGARSTNRIREYSVTGYIRICEKDFSIHRFGGSGFQVREMTLGSNEVPKFLSCGGSERLGADRFGLIQSQPILYTDASTSPGLYWMLRLQRKPCVGFGK